MFCSEDLVVFDRRKTISELIYEVLVNLRTVKRSLMMKTVTRRAVSVLRRKRKRSVVSNKRNMRNLLPFITDPLDRCILAVMI